MVTADSAYGGRSVLQKLPPNVHLISHAHPKAALYAPAPLPVPHQKGRRRKKGARLPGMAAWAQDATRPWETLPFDQFGLHATLQVKVMQALYYKAGKDRLLTLVLTRDATGKRPDALFYCTLLAWDARTILSTYAGRWALEAESFRLSSYSASVIATIVPEPSSVALAGTGLILLLGYRVCRDRSAQTDPRVRPIVALG